MDERVAAAVSHWGPRFTTNGVTAGDFARITASFIELNFVAASAKVSRHQPAGEATANKDKFPGHASNPYPG